jgi:hypothetical protein
MNRISTEPVDGKITLVPLCNRHAGSLPEEYIYEALLKPYCFDSSPDESAVR